MNINDKPTIETALVQRLPTPWKLTTCDGPPTWKVIRQRPENFTVELYERLKNRGLKENEIRELFCVQNENWATMKSSMGLVKKHGLATWMANDDKPVSYSDTHSPIVDSTQVPQKVNRHIVAIPSDLPRIPMGEPVLRAHDVVAKPAVIVPAGNGMATSEDPDGLNYADRHCLGIDKPEFPHQPTPVEVEGFFEGPAVPVAKKSLVDLAFDLIAAEKVRVDATQKVQDIISEIGRRS